MYFTEILQFRSIVHTGWPHLADCEFVEIFKPFFTFFLIEAFPHYLKTQWDCTGTEKCNPYVLEPFTVKLANYYPQYFKHLKCIL